MNRISLAMLALFLSSNAMALKGIEDGKAWNKAPDSARSKLAKDIVQLNKGTYSDAQMKACIDAYYAAPASAVQLEQDIISTAIRCDAKLKPRK